MILTAHSRSWASKDKIRILLTTVSSKTTIALHSCRGNAISSKFFVSRSETEWLRSFLEIIGSAKRGTPNNDLRKKRNSRAWSIIILLIRRLCACKSPLLLVVLHRSIENMLFLSPENVSIEPLICVHPLSVCRITSSWLINAWPTDEVKQWSRHHTQTDLYNVECTSSISEHSSSISFFAHDWTKFLETFHHRQLCWTIQAHRVEFILIFQHRANYVSSSLRRFLRSTVSGHSLSLSLLLDSSTCFYSSLTNLQ